MDSTESTHKSKCMAFVGKYANIRASLDYTYHSNYKEERQKLQDDIVETMVNTVHNCCGNNGVNDRTRKPWIIFTAGAMGVGKSRTIRRLISEGKLTPRNFVWIDPDDIRRQLPEFSSYSRQCPIMAGTLTQKESGLLTEVATLAALRAGRNVLVEGTLRNANWYQKHFARLRNECKGIKIIILYVVAPAEVVIQRADDRARMTGRIIPREIILRALSQVPESVEVLASLADCCLEVDSSEKQLILRVRQSQDGGNPSKVTNGEGDFSQMEGVLHIVTARNSITVANFRTRNSMGAFLKFFFLISTLQTACTLVVMLLCVQRFMNR